MNTAFWHSFETIFITSSVNHCQPQPEWLFAACSRTVSVVFKSSTPSLAHFVKSPQSVGSSMPISLFISLKMFLSDGGSSTPAFTEKHSPCA